MYIILSMAKCVRHRCLMVSYVCMYVCMHACMYVCMHVWLYACMHVCMYACMDACMYVCVCVCIYVCMHVCMHVCACIYIYIYTQSFHCLFVFYTYTYAQYSDTLVLNSEFRIWPPKNVLGVVQKWGMPQHIRFTVNRKMKLMSIFIKQTERLNQTETVSFSQYNWSCLSTKNGDDAVIPLNY